MPSHEIKNVPESKLIGGIKNLLQDGAIEVCVRKQSDGTYTIKAAYPS